MIYIYIFLHFIVIFIKLFVILKDSLLVDGVAFKKTFSYAGFEQQPKSFKNPKILSLNIELELKAEKDNAEVRIDDVSVHIIFYLIKFVFLMVIL
jgi:chaperonin GroEL (HSP60 family)